MVMKGMFGLSPRGTLVLGKRDVMLSINESLLREIIPGFKEFGCLLLGATSPDAGEEAN